MSSAPTSKPVPVYPALGGEAQLYLPHLLDFHLQHNPDVPLYVYPNTTSGSTSDQHSASGSVTEIKGLEYVRAAHRAARAVYARDNSTRGDVIGIVANIDSLLYSALIVGIIKAGFVPFPISPRNSPAALLHLIRKTSVHRLITTQATLQNLVDGLKAEIQASDPEYVLTIEEAPSVREVFPVLGRERKEDPFDPFISNWESGESLKDSDKGIYLHSSGSTGFPKPILFTHKIIKSDATALYIPKFREFFASRPIMGAFVLPTFHMLGFCYHVLMPLYGLIPTGIMAPAVTTSVNGHTLTTDEVRVVPTAVTPETVLEAMKIVKPLAILVVPTFLHAWAASDEAVEFLSTLEYCGFGGGPLAPRIAESLIARGVPVQAGYGGTEFGIITELRVRNPDWEYMEFREGIDIRWVPQGDGTYEAHYLTSKSHQIAVENLPDIAGYASSDLFCPHPTIPNLWKIVGRVDDVVIHSSGEKTVPAPMEAVISASPMLSGAIIFGRQRDQPGVLVEALPAYHINVKSDEEVSKFRNMLWPVIEDANKIAPSFSRIFREMILIVDPKKPLPRVGKGTVARKAALALYEAEIDQLYETIEANSGGDSVELPNSWEANDVQAWLGDQISSIVSTKVPAPTEDLFEHGFDSLSSTILRLRLIAALRKAGFSTSASAVNQSIVYSHPTIMQLTQAIINLVANPSPKEIESQVDAVKSHVDGMEEMIAKYSQGLDDALPRSTEEPIDPKQHYILLTGSTGNIGAQLLESLLLNDSVARVYTLNRPSAKKSMYDRHLARFQDKGLDVAVLSSLKLVFLSGETAREDLGLAEDIVKEIRQNVTTIIHNAWRLDFNLSLPSFESHVKGARALINLARSSRHGSSIRFLFTSSVSSAQSWNALARGPYPEKVMMDARYAVGAGYGESKYVTERILAKSGLQATSFRIGQVTGGAPNGAWATTDWVPILVKSSLSINQLPDAFGVVSWIPMDAVCKALLEIGLSVDSDGPATVPIAVNVVHPKPVSWSSVMQNIRNVLVEEKKLPLDALPLVPYSDWVAAVEKHTRNLSEDDAENIPAIKLLQFFKSQARADDALRESGSNTTESAGLTPLSTANVEKLSESTRALEPLDGVLIQKWVRYWVDAGFL
ncbi:hypothetical protein GYMLUDRAFT_40511 [Collybiopsis luxurians FD-317 M1]|uniref:L-aminoadipate-semialdehyde dehydrogenase n=1 Tax=Collybiopsis luxurians FD-317 M1 TaxID=944289 RepID=A0A0D0C7N3_9AGAR|nr:hypothetical protein GYMLUDRAFT_40511 [Collybiopsis luxurians FD-317 M1]